MLYLPDEQAAMCILFLPVPGKVGPVFQPGDNLEMSNIPLRLSILGYFFKLSNFDFFMNVSIYLTNVRVYTVPLF